MATSSYDSVFSLETGRISVPSGATNAVLFDSNVVPECVGAKLRYVSGGTLEIIGVTMGVTLAAATLAAASGNSWPFLAADIYDTGGPSRFYLSATGATVVVAYIRNKSESLSR